MGCGEQIGNWTVLEKDPNSKRRSTKWFCRCICGRVYSRHLSTLRRTRPKNCLECIRIDLVDKAFGLWTVTHRDPNWDPRMARWMCRCICGTVKAVKAVHLLSGRSTRCLSCKNRSEQCNGRLSMLRIYRIKRGAEKRGISYHESLTRDVLMGLYEAQTRLCAISGVPISFSNTHKECMQGGDTASLDRIDSSRPYEPGNVWWVHKTVNLMKNVLTVIQLREWCDIIRNSNDIISILVKDFWKGTNESMVDRRLDPTDDIDTTTESEAA